MARGKKRSRKFGKNAPSQLMTWNPRMNDRAPTIQRRLTIAASALATNGSGIATINIGVAQMRASAAEWASFAARYTEYRLLGIRLHVTDNALSSSVASAGVLVLATDPSGTSSPTTVAQAFSQTRPSVFNLDNTSPRAITYSAKAVDLEEQDWTAVGTTSTSFSVVGVAFSGVSITVGLLFAEFFAEFRGAQ